MENSMQRRAQRILGFIFSIIMLLLVGVILTKAFATENSTLLTTTVSEKVNSEGHYANLSVAAKTKSVKQIKAVNASGETRENNIEHTQHNDVFDIFSASSLLITDTDYDGYYHKFSITFDADVTANYAEVYAQLYLSRNGGPWQHYFTTEDFVIHGDSNQDSYEVITNLAADYPSDTYDVLIDLYVVGDDLPVASFSDSDSNELYALPLEDAHRDQEQTAYYYEEHDSYGGSFSWGLLMLVIAVFVIREWRINFAK
jgi:hypothetical protein